MNYSDTFLGEIQRLKNKGYSNAVIAQKLGVTTTQVSEATQIPREDLWHPVEP